MAIVKNLEIFWMTIKTIYFFNEFSFWITWRIMQISDAVIPVGLQLWWIALSSICIFYNSSHHNQPHSIIKCIGTYKNNFMYMYCCIVKITILDLLSIRMKTSWQIIPFQNVQQNTRLCHHGFWETWSSRTWNWSFVFLSIKNKKVLDASQGSKMQNYPYIISSSCHFMYVQCSH